MINFTTSTEDVNNAQSNTQIRKLAANAGAVFYLVV